MQALHPVDALLVNRGTVKSRWKALDVDNFVLLLQLFLCSWRVGGSCGERAKASQRQKDAGQDNEESNQDTEIEEG